MVKALLLHVDVDWGTKNDMTLGVNGPIFDDGTFEFIPVLELWELEWSKNVYFLKKGKRIVVISDKDEYVTTSDGKKLRLESTVHKFTLTSETRTYSEVGARNKQYSRQLSEYLPQEYANAIIHFDPDFDHFTYGDSVNTSKGVQISKLEENDYIFFVASLAPYSKESYAGRDKKIIRYYQQGKMAKYVVGYFKVQNAYYAEKTPHDPVFALYDIPRNSTSANDKAIDEDTLARIIANVHTKRNEDRYYVVVGKPSESILLTHSIRLTQNGSPFRPDKIGKETYGNVGFPRGWKWIRNPTRIQNLLNYCRSCL